MTTSNKNQEMASLSLGEHFRLAREALNLSLDDVSKQLNLRPSILQRLENNEFSHNSISVTYIKGYIRNYAKFLRLPENIWGPVTTSLTETSKNDLTRGVRATRAVNEYSSHNRWIGWISAIVVIALLGLTTLWWWENYQRSNAERDNLVQSYVDTQKENVATEPNVLEKTETTKENESSANAHLTVAPLSNVSNNEPVVPIEGNVVSMGEKKEENTSTQVLQSELHKMDTESDQVIGSNSSAVQISDVLSTSNAEVLRIEVTGTNCWISVKDGNRKVLAQKEYTQGEILSFNQNESYSLIIGAPGNVKITYKGEDYPLKVDGRVAKFKLQ